MPAKQRPATPTEWTVSAMVLAIVVLLGIGAYGLLAGSGEDQAEQSEQASAERQIDDFAAAIQSAGDSSGFQPVDSVKYLNRNTVVIWVDSSWSLQPMRVRRSLARTMLSAWRGIAGDSGRILIYGPNGNEVGGTRLTGSAWVEE